VSDTWSFVPTITASNGQRGISINLAEFEVSQDSELLAHVPCLWTFDWGTAHVGLDRLLIEATLHALECPHHEPVGFFSDHGALDIGILPK